MKLYETLIAGCPARAGCPRRARCPRSLWSPQNLDSSWGKARASQHRGYATSTLPLSHGRVAEWAGRARNRRARRLLLQALWRRSQPSLPGSAHPPIMAHGAYRPSPIAHCPWPMAHRLSPIAHRPSPIAHRPSPTPCLPCNMPKVVPQHGTIQPGPATSQTRHFQY